MPKPLLELIAGVIGADVSEVGNDADLETLATWDSQREVELALELEFNYGITLSEDDMNHLHSVRDVRSVLRAHGVCE